MSEIKPRDFSIREEIEVAIQENDLDLSIDDVLDEVENDELMLDVITLAVYEAIKEKLNERNQENKEVEHKILQSKQFILKALMDRDIL